MSLVGTLAEGLELEGDCGWELVEADLDNCCSPTFFVGSLMCRFLSCFLVAPGDEAVAVVDPDSDFLVSFATPSLVRPMASPLVGFACWVVVRLLKSAGNEEDPSS